MKPIICRYCYKEIEKRDQLITASNWVSIRPFHYVCFHELEKEITSQRKLWTQLNSIGGTIKAVLMLTFSIWMFTTSTLGGIGDLLGLLTLFPVAQRILSFMFYELKVPS